MHPSKILLPPLARRLAATPRLPPFAEAHFLAKEENSGEETTSGPGHHTKGPDPAVKPDNGEAGKDTVDDQKTAVDQQAEYRAQLVEKANKIGSRALMERGGVWSVHYFARHEAEEARKKLAAMEQKAVPDTANKSDS